jgi:hypothetical protein
MHGESSTQNYQWKEYSKEGDSHGKVSEKIDELFVWRTAFRPVFVPLDEGLQVV